MAGIATLITAVPAGAQDAGLWPVEKVEKDRALQPAGAQRAGMLAHYLLASRMLNDHGAEVALPLFRNILAYDSGSCSLALRVASLASAAGQPAGALRLLNDTVRRHPGNEAALLALTRFFVDRQDESVQARSEAFSAVRQATAKFPGSADICRLAVRMYISDQRRPDAQAAVRQTLARDSRDPRFWLAMTPAAREAFPLDDPDTREAHTAIVTGCMEKAVALCGNDPSVLEAAADFYARLPAHGKATEYYRKLAALQPGNLTARRKLGQVLRLTGDLAEARKLFEELLQIDVSDAVSHRAMVSILDAAGEAKEALKHRMELLRIDGGTADEYLKLAAQLQESHMEEENRLTLERGCFAHPASARLRIQLAGALHRAGRVAEASAQYGNASELAENADPNSLDDAFYLGRAECARDAGQQPEALGYYRKAIDKTPKGKAERAVPAYCGLAILWLEEGKKLEEARELLRLASALKKDAPEVSEALGLYAARKGDWQTALKEYQRAETASTRVSAGLLLRLTDAFEHTDQKEAAVARLEKAATLPNADPSLRSRLDALRGAPQKAQPQPP